VLAGFLRYSKQAGSDNGEREAQVSIERSADSGSRHHAAGRLEPELQYFVRSVTSLLTTPQVDDRIIVSAQYRTDRTSKPASADAAKEPQS